MGTVLDKLVSKLGRKIQPADEFYRFSDEELQDEIEDAFTYAYPEIEDIETLSKEEQLQVLTKAISSCYYVLAGKHAENIRFRIENDEYHGDQANTAYRILAKQYENAFNENKSIMVNTVTRTQTGTGLKAPYGYGDTP